MGRHTKLQNKVTRKMVYRLHWQIKTLDNYLMRAIITYVKANFRNPPNYANLISSYETQLGKLMVTDGYTDYSMISEESEDPEETEEPEEPEDPEESEEVITE
jgi:hypothetical protein